MSPVPEFLTNAFERIFFRPAIVADVKELAGHFRLVEIAGESLKGETWMPGQKVQFHLGNMVARTYTPMEWNAIEGTAQFLMFLHGNGPGSEWAASLRKGAPCQFIGPRSSLDLTGLKEPVTFFGDETSLGVAQAIHLKDEGRRNRYVFEVSSLVESEEVLRSIGLTGAELIQKSPHDAHLETVGELLADAGVRAPLHQWIFTGKAQSIQMLRKFFRARRLLLSKVKVKAYWAEGKAGLD